MADVGVVVVVVVVPVVVWLCGRQSFGRLCGWAGMVDGCEQVWGWGWDGGVGSGGGSGRGGWAWASGWVWVGGLDWVLVGDSWLHLLVGGLVRLGGCGIGKL